MQLHTIRQAATRLAVSTTTIRRLIKMTELPAIRIGRCVRLREEDVEALIRRDRIGRSSNKQREMRR